MTSLHPCCLDAHPASLLSPLLNPVPELLQLGRCAVLLRAPDEPPVPEDDGHGQLVRQNEPQADREGDPPDQRRLGDVHQLVVDELHLYWLRLLLGGRNSDYDAAGEVVLLHQLTRLVLQVVLIVFKSDLLR